jgi:cephalosporin-C deacetylase
VQLERLRFCSLGGAAIGGYLLRWRDDRPRRLVVHGHGYGGQVSPRWSWASAGLNVVGVDVRGWGRSRAALASPSPWGWVLSGIESPERSVLRGAVCDYLRAAVVGRGLLGDATSRVVLQGGSLAGGLALMAGAAWPTCWPSPSRPSAGPRAGACWPAPARRPRSTATWSAVPSTRPRT